MDRTQSSSSPEPDGSSSGRRRDVLRDAIQYWEPRRVIYNGVLTAVVVTWVAWTWPHFRAALTSQSFFALSMLAILANLCYCAAYLADIPMQYSPLRTVWRRGRWLLLLVGMLFAVVVATTGSWMRSIRQFARGHPSGISAVAQLAEERAAQLCG